MFPNWQNPGGGYAAQQAMGQWGQQQWGQIPPQHALWSGFVGLGAAQQQLPLPQLNISSVDGASTTNEQAPPLPSSPAPPVPVEPAPSEEQPPLPPEPPPVPPEPASQGSEKELKPKSNEEQEKLMQLQQQAQQWQQQQYQWPQSAWQQGWQQQQQWMAQYGYAQYQQPGGMPHQQPHGAPPSGGQPNVPQQTAAKTPDNPAQIGDPAMDAILKEEAEFNQQYTQWKQQYDDWKAQNKNHPNKEQFQQYEHQWQTYEKQMEDKRLDITTRKRQIQQNIATKTEHQEDQHPGQHSRTPDQQFIGRGGPRFDGPRFPGPGGQGQMRGPRPGMEHGPRLGMEMGSRPRMEGGPSPRMGMRGPHPGGQKGGMARGQIPDMKGPRGPGPRFGQPGFGQFGNNDPGYDENQDMGGENFNYDEQNEGKDIAQEEDMDLEDNDEESNNMSQNQHGQGQRMGQNQMRGPRPFFGQGPRPSIGQGPRHQFGPRGQMGQGPMRGQMGQGMRGQMGQGPRGQFGQGPRFQANQNRMPQGQGSWMGQSGEQVGNQKESSETEEEYNDEDYDEQNPFDTGPGLREPKSFGRGNDISGGNPRMLGPRGRGQNFESNMRGAGPRGPSPFLRGSNPQMQQRGRPRGPVPLMSLSISKPQPSEESKVDLPLNQKEKLKLEQQRDQALQQGENWSSVQHKRQQKQNEKVEEGNKQAQQQKPNVEQADNKPVTDQNKAKTETSADNQKSQDDNKDQNNHDLMGNTTELKKNEGEKVKEDEEGVKPLGKGLGAVFNMLKSEGNKDEEPGEPQIPGFGDPPPDKNEDPNKNLKGLGHTLQMLQGGNEEGPSEDQNSQGVQEGFPNDFPWQEKLLGKMHEMLSQQEAPLQFRGRGNMGGARGRGRGRGHVNMRDQQEEFGQEDFDDQYGQENFGRGRGAFQQQGFEEQEFSPKNFRGRGGRGRGGFNRQDFEEQQEFSQQNTRGRGGHQDFGRGRGGFRGQGQENDFEEQGFSQQNIRGRGGLGRAQQAARGRGQRGGRGFGRGPHQEQRWGERGEWNEEDNGIQGRTEEEITQEDNEWNGSQAGREFDNRFDDRYPNQRPREGLDRWGDRRSPPPPRYPYGRPDDPFADRLDPYYDRRDPYPRDPYAYPPHGYPPTYRYEDRRLFYDDPYRPYDYGARYPVTPEVERPYQPPEVIDHGHKSSLDLGIEREPPAAYVAPQTVIDYGHGRTSDNSSRKDDRGDNLSSERSRYGDRDRDRDRDRDSFRSEPYGDLRDMGYNRSSSVPIHEPKIETVNVDDILLPPGRKSRPAQIVVIIRGLPGSGKSYVGKLLKDKEVQHGGGAPRMLCLDDYFMIETEKIEKDPETGKRVKKKILEYEYEAGMEDTYRQNMYKSFKKTIDDGFFSFIIVDAVNEKTKHYEEFWSHAKSKGFQVYIAELQADVSTCAKRNTHKRSTKEIEKIKKQWQETPRHYLRLDIRSLLQEASITEVEMEDEQATPAKKQKKEEEEEEADDPFMSRFGGVYKKSKWEIEASGSQLDKLDGIKLGKRKRSPSPQTMEDFLQLAGESSRPLIPGQKRVRWADIEERKEQMRRREIGFVVGQTQRDWERITDDSFAERQLNRTKYF